MGRKTKCTPNLIQEISQVLAAGNYICVACEYVGITQATYFSWVNRATAELERVEEEGGEVSEHEEIFVEFLKSATRARSSAEVQSVARLRKAGESDWKADAFFLERSFPDRWGRRNLAVDVTSKGEKIDGPVIYLPGRDDEAD